MPRNSLTPGTNAQKVSKQTPATPMLGSSTSSMSQSGPTTSSSKRGIRWFVHPPSFSFANSNNNNNNNNNNNSSSNNSSRRQSTPSKPSSSSSNNANDRSTPIKGKRSWTGRGARNTPSTSLSLEHHAAVTPLVDRLRRELDEAREQIQVLETIKALQAQETEALKRQQRQQQQQQHLLQQQQQQHVITTVTASSPSSSAVTKGRILFPTTSSATTAVAEYAVLSLAASTTQTTADVSTTMEGEEDDSDSDSGSESPPSPEYMVWGARTGLMEDAGMGMGMEGSTTRAAMGRSSSEDDDGFGMGDENDSTRSAAGDQNSVTSPANKTPSMSGPFWQALAFENAEGVDILDEDDIQELQRMEAVPASPPSEVMTIREPPPTPGLAVGTTTADSSLEMVTMLHLRLQDADQRAGAYRQKLETSQDLVASLFRDLERARRSIQTLASRNITISSHVKGLKADQEENMVYRSSLLKASLYVSPVFILFGGLEYFVSAIVLIWILIEMEASWLMDGDDEDDDEEDEKEHDAMKKLQEKEVAPIAKDLPIPKNIVLSSSSAALENRRR